MRIFQLIFITCVLSVVLLGCCRDSEIIVTGRITNAKTGVGIHRAVISLKRDSSAISKSTVDGYYVLAGCKAGDTIIAVCHGYVDLSYILPDEYPIEGKILRGITLTPLPDTAYTITGPVEADRFLDNIQVRRKKLSPNEARIVVMQKLPGVKVGKGMLVVVNGKEEWLFNLRFGHNNASVYVNVFSGEIRSIESDDPVFDKKLQSIISE